MEFVEHPKTYEEALDNLTEENWHTERRLIEEKVIRLEERSRFYEAELMRVRGFRDECDRQFQAMAERAAVAEGEVELLRQQLKADSDALTFVRACTRCQAAWSSDSNISRCQVCGGNLNG